MLRFLLVMILFSSLFACSSNTSMPELRLPIDASLDVSLLEPTHRFNISISNFDISAADKNASRFQSGLLFAESSYMPVVLKDTLMKSKHWGAVRVLPEVDPSAELMISSKIIHSDAVELHLQVRVVDSSGHIWIDKLYVDTSLDHAYMPRILGGQDPFQDLYNKIANDIYVFSQTLEEKQKQRILDMSMLRYAIALSAEGFSEYLGDELSLVSLPARNDPLYKRVKKIRESEYRFIDVMDSQYQAFYKRMQSAYPYWREYSFELMVYNDKLESRGGLSSNRSRGTWKALETAYKSYKEYKLNEDELRELGNSLSLEIAPTVAKLDGKVIELNGSLAVQYKEWRSLLTRFYNAER